MKEFGWADIGPVGLRTMRKRPDWCWAQRKRRNKRNAEPAEFQPWDIVKLLYIFFKTLSINSKQF
jgi:hypothetical protein